MRELQVIEKNIELAKREDVTVCIWGAGLLGKTVGYNALGKLGICLDYYLDNNEKLWGKEIIDGILCIDFHQLLKKNDREQIVCLISLSVLNKKNVIEQLKELGVNHYISLEEILSVSDVLYDIFPFMERRTVAYTCIVGNYDNLMEPNEEVLEKYDYYLISDNKPKSDSVYKWINIKNVVPETVTDFTRMNRYCKINAHKIFPNYRNSIYYDGNIALERDLDSFFGKLRKTRIGIASPLPWECIYEEAARLLPQMRDEPERIYSQMEKYWNEGMPKKFGTGWCNVLIREHNHPVCVKLMEDWWNEVESQSKRDQLSFPYVIWKNNYSMEEVLMIEDSYDNLLKNSLYWKYIVEHNVSRHVNVRDDLRKG